MQLRTLIHQLEYDVWVRLVSRRKLLPEVCKVGIGDSNVRA